MTSITGRRSGNVVWIFPGRSHAIMTRRTDTRHLAVVNHRDRNPVARAVTGITRVGRINVLGRLTRCLCSIVAFDARLVADRAMVKTRCQPAIDIMAAPAFQGSL